MLIKVSLDLQKRMVFSNLTSKAQGIIETKLGAKHCPDIDWGRDGVIGQEDHKQKTELPRGVQGLDGLLNGVLGLILVCKKARGDGGFLKSGQLNTIDISEVLKGECRHVLQQPAKIESFTLRGPSWMEASDMSVQLGTQDDMHRRLTQDAATLQEVIGVRCPCWIVTNGAEHGPVLRVGEVVKVAKDAIVNEGAHGPDKVSVQ